MPLPASHAPQNPRRRLLIGSAALLGPAPWLAACTAPPARPARSCPAEPRYVGAAPRAALQAEVWPAFGPDPSIGQTIDRGSAAALDGTLQTLFERLQPPAIDAALFIPGRGLWQRSLGLAEVQPVRPLADSHVFWWASCGKTLTAGAIVQCMHEGRLAPGDRLQRWLPAFPQAEQITIGQLLDHTAGTLSFNHPALGNNPLNTRHLTPQQLLQVPMAQGLLSCPGSLFSYSNTGYLLLALVLEAIDGQPFHLALQRRVLTPLGITRLRALAPEESLQTLATPHDGRTPHPAWGIPALMGAGNVVGRADAFLRFWHGLLTARLMPQPLVQGMWQRLLPTGASPGLWYGQGVMVMEFQDPGGPPRLWLAHPGGSPQANGVVLYEPARRAYAAVAINSAVSAVAVANALLRTAVPD